MSVRPYAVASYIFAILLSGCANQTEAIRLSLVAASTLADGAWDVARPIYHDKCMTAVKVCLARGDEVCEEKTACQQQRQYFANVITEILELSTELMGLIESSGGVTDDVVSKYYKVMSLKHHLLEAGKDVGLWTKK